MTLSNKHHYPVICDLAGENNFIFYLCSFLLCILLLSTSHRGMHLAPMDHLLFRFDVDK